MDTASESSTHSSDFLVLSHEHHLLPIAHKLSNIEKQPLVLAAWKKAYERAWAGMLKPNIRSRREDINRDSITRLIDAAVRGEHVVLCDVPSLADAFNDAPLAYTVYNSKQLLSLNDDTIPLGVPVRLGWWHTPNATPSTPHALVYDMGAWPGGVGRWVPGGITLLATANEDLFRLICSAAEKVSTACPSFRGLVNVGVTNDTLGNVVLEGYELGWPALQTYAWLGNLDMQSGFSKVLLGRVQPVFNNIYSVAMPISVPPWPPNIDAKVRGQSTYATPITLNEKLHEYMYWFDVQVDMKSRTLTTAGLDGLIGILHTQAAQFETARQRALGVVNVLDVHEKQFRPDVGNRVYSVLAGLEQELGLVL